VNDVEGLKVARRPVTQVRTVVWLSPTVECYLSDLYNLVDQLSTVDGFMETLRIDEKPIADALVERGVAVMNARHSYGKGPRCASFLAQLERLMELPRHQIELLPSQDLGHDTPGGGTTADAAPEIAAGITRLQARIDYLELALKKIVKREGRFSRDPLTHASNTIDDLCEVAQLALDGSWKDPHTAEGA
jgi:hypothetical protein